MDIKEAITKLHAELKGNSNIQCIGEGKDKIFIYTIKQPSGKDLLVTEYEGFPVSWNRIGKMEIKRSKDGGI